MGKPSPDILNLFVATNYKFSTKQPGRSSTWYFSDPQQNYGRFRREHPQGPELVYQGRCSRMFISPILQKEYGEVAEAIVAQKIQEHFSPQVAASSAKAASALVNQSMPEQMAAALKMDREGYVAAAAGLWKEIAEEPGLAEGLEEEDEEAHAHPLAKKYFNQMGGAEAAHRYRKFLKIYPVLLAGDPHGQYRDKASFDKKDSWHLFDFNGDKLHFSAGCITPDPDAMEYFRNDGDARMREYDGPWDKW